jgi:hypothetical protein
MSSSAPLDSAQVKQQKEDRSAAMKVFDHMTNFSTNYFDNDQPIDPKDSLRLDTMKEKEIYFLCFDERTIECLKEGGKYTTDQTPFQYPDILRMQWYDSFFTRPDLRTDGGDWVTSVAPYLKTIENLKTRFILVLHATQWSLAEIKSETNTYTPGFIIGNVCIYDYGTKKLVGIFSVSVSNTSGLSVSVSGSMGPTTAADDLANDLKLNFYRSVRKSLEQKAGPDHHLFLIGMDSEPGYGD